MLFVIAAPLIAFVAGRYTAPEARATPIVTVKREVVAAAVPVVDPVHCPTQITNDVDDEVEDDDPDAIDVENTDALKILDQESRRITMLETGLGVRGGLRGQIRDARSGEILVGVTVVASTGAESQTAITDETGSYEIMGLDPASYTVTIYYLDATVEHRDVVVASSKITPLFAKVDTTPQPQITITLDEGIEQGITIDHNYVKNIPVPGRTFGSVLAADPDAEIDGEGVSFSGVTTLENHYVIDDQVVE